MPEQPIEGEAAVLLHAPNGAPVAGTEISLLPVLAGDTPGAPREGAAVAHTTTDAAGRATFRGIRSTGRYRAVAADLAVRPVTVEVTAPTTATTSPPAAAPPAAPPAAAPPAAPARAATVTATAVSKRSKLKVDVNPNMGRGFWTFQVQSQRPDGTWQPLKTYKTKGSKETRTINLKRGTYRVVVHAKYGYAGTTSASVYLTK